MRKKQLRTIFSYEFQNTAKTKSFLFTTILLALVIVVGLSFPRLRGDTADVENEASTFMDANFNEKSIAICDPVNGEATKQFFSMAFAESAKTKVETVSGTIAELEGKVRDGSYDYVLVFEDLLNYTLITQNVSMTDMNSAMLDEMVLQNYRVQFLQLKGASAEESVAFGMAQTQQTILATGADNTNSYWYAFVLMMLLYFTIFMYGQIVAQSVANEKSSRAMELLITSAKPSSLMFGKVFGVGCAGLLQMIVWLACAIGAYQWNKSYWADNAIINSLFGASSSVLIYTVVFFLLGYFLYAFLYGALGSLASRVEDVSTLAMPLTMLFVVMFLVSLYSMIFNFIDSLLIKVMSFFPLTSPLAMFIRVLNHSAASWEIALSIGLLVASVIATGYLSAGIYRVGVLMYGKPPKLKEVIRLMRHNAS